MTYDLQLVVFKLCTPLSIGGALYFYMCKEKNMSIVQFYQNFDIRYCQRNIK